MTWSTGLDTGSGIFVTGFFPQTRIVLCVDTAAFAACSGDSCFTNTILVENMTREKEGILS